MVNNKMLPWDNGNIDGEENGQNVLNKKYNKGKTREQAHMSHVEV